MRNAILNQKSGILAEDTLNRRVIQKKNNGPRYGLSQDISHRASGVFRMTTTKNLLQNTPLVYTLKIIIIVMVLVSMILMAILCVMN